MYHENPSSGSGVVSCGQTDRQMTDGRSERRRELTKLNVAFRSFANGPEKHFEVLANYVNNF